MTRWYIFNILYHETEEISEGVFRVKQPKPETPPETTAERFRRICRERGMQEHRIDARVADMLHKMRRR